MNGCAICWSSLDWVDTLSALQWFPSQQFWSVFLSTGNLMKNSFTNHTNKCTVNDKFKINSFFYLLFHSNSISNCSMSTNFSVYSGIKAPFWGTFSRYASVWSRLNSTFFWSAPFFCCSSLYVFITEHLIKYSVNQWIFSTKNKMIKSFFVKSLNFTNSSKGKFWITSQFFSHFIWFQILIHRST